MRNLLNSLSIITMIVVNALANILPINGVTTGEVAGKFDVVFKPQGYAFSIWGLIYLGLIVFAVYQSLPKVRDKYVISRLGYWVPLSCLFNMGWIFAWHYQQYALSLVCMLGLLFALIRIYGKQSLKTDKTPEIQVLMCNIPFSLYIGWICVATIANVTIVLEHYGFSGLGMPDSSWGGIMLFAVVFLAAVILVLNKDVVFLMVLAWAIIAISKRTDLSTEVVTTSEVMAIAILLMVLTAMIFNLKKERLFA